MQNILSSPLRSTAKKALAMFLAIAMVILSLPTMQAKADTTTQYKAGTYTVTANLAFDSGMMLTDPNATEVPPTTAASNNAQLSVAEDGTMTLQVSLTSNALGLLSAGTSSNATVVSAPVTSRTFTNDVTKDAVSSLKLSLSDASGSYAFTGNTLYMAPMSATQENQQLTLSVDFSGVTVKDTDPDAGGDDSGKTPATAIAIDVPSAAEKLTYNRTEQVGVAEGEGYTVENGSATNADTYTATVTLKDGYKWSDDTTDSKEITYSIDKATLKASYVGESIDAGSTPALTVDVTGFVNGETAETAAGYKAPVVTAPESLSAGSNYELAPANGEATNYKFTYLTGTLAVKAGNSNGLKPGEYTVTARLFLRAMYSPMNMNMYLTASEANATPPRNYAEQNGTLKVANDGTATLSFPVSSNALGLTAFGSASNATVVDTTSGARHYQNPANPSLQRDYDGIQTITVTLNDLSGIYDFTGCNEYMAPMGVTWNKDLRLAVDFTGVPGATVVNPDDNNANTNNSSNNEQATSNAQKSGKLAAGSYTVSANFHISRSTSGLPMEAYLTNSNMPPNSAVSNNATLVVDESGRALVTVPITIKVMSLESISGLNIVSAQRDSSGYITSVTVDLGVLENPNSTYSQACTVRVHLGEMAQSMSGFDPEQTWACTFTVNLSGVAMQNGSVVSGSPQTGDAAPMVPLSIAVLVSAAALFCARRKLAA